MCLPKALPSPGKIITRNVIPALWVPSRASSPSQLSPEHSKATLPMVSNPASLLYLRKGQEEFQGFFFSKINRTLDLFHKKKKRGSSRCSQWGLGWSIEKRVLLPRGKGDQDNLPSFLPKEFFHGRTVKVTRGTKQHSVAFPGEARRAWQ